LRVLVRLPLAYLRGLKYAVCLASGDPRRTYKAVLYFVEAIVLGEWMRSQMLDHLHVHFASEAATVGLIADQVFPIGFSLTVHGPDEFHDTPGYYLTTKIESADFIACISHFARSQLMRLSPAGQWRKLKVAPLGIDPNIFKPRELKRESGPFEILCVGRLVPSKGQHILLAAIARLRESGRDLRLRLVGSGPDLQSLKHEVECRGLADYVRFEGNVNQDRIRGIYAEADAFVLASSAEGVPIVLMEAMAMAIPCVATHVCGIPELIRNEVDGLLVAPSDERGLAEAIGRLIDDPELGQRLGCAGRQRIVERYDLSWNVIRLANMFADHIANRPQIIEPQRNRSLLRAAPEFFLNESSDLKVRIDTCNTRSTSD
jgi:glycosyltransferase involved in cell wall biosynthesis